MNGQPDDRALRPEDVGLALAAHGFDVDRTGMGAIVMAAGDPLRVVWANSAAVALFGSSRPEELLAQIFAGRGRGGLGDSLLRLAADAAPRSERLRLIRGFRSRTLQVAISRTTIGDGRTVYAVVVPPDDLAAGATEEADVSVLAGPPGPAPALPPDPAKPLPEPAAPSVPTGLPRPDKGPARPGARGSARILWQTDAEHRLVRLDGGHPDLLGMGGGGALLGRSILDVVATDEVTRDRLAASLRSAAPWSGLQATWPIAAGGGHVPVTLGAVPIMPSTSRFGGYRGFGVTESADIEHGRVAEPPDGSPAASADPDIADPPPSIASPAAAEDPPVPPRLSDRLAVFRSGDRFQTRRRTDLQDPPPSVVAPPAADERPPPIMDRAVDRGLSDAEAGDVPGPRRISFSSKVVALRPLRSRAPEPLGTEAGRAGDDVAHVEPLSPASPAGSNLTVDERSNFDEIARTLQTGPDASTSAAGAPAEAAPANSALVALDRLAGAALVIAGDEPAYANAAFLQVSGFRSIAEMREAGVAAPLFDGRDAAGEVADPDWVRVVLNPAIGAPIAGTLATQPIIWKGADARLVTFAPNPAIAARPTPINADPLRAELAEYGAIVSAIAEPLATLDRSGRLLSANAAASRLFGRAEDGLLGESIVALVEPQHHAPVIKALAEASRSVQSLDITSRTGAGALLGLTMALRAVGPGKLLATWREPPEQATLQQELALVRQELDQAKVMKSDFLAKVSHEVRTPLNAILGFAEVILDEPFGPLGSPRYKDYLNDIHESGAQVMTLVADLLDLSKMEAERAEMAPTAIDANRIIGECVGALQVAAHRERVIMRLSLMPRLPPVLADAGAFRQIVTNILTNAINFNEPGGQVIVSTAVSEAGSVAVRVRDTGIGMTEAEIAMAMEPFRQISSGKPGGGNGLGLPLTRALIEANRATMSIKSRKDEGTLVEIVFRAARAEPLRLPAE